jgi:hypothetical protein
LFTKDKGGKGHPKGEEHLTYLGRIPGMTGTKRLTMLHPSMIKEHGLNHPTERVRVKERAPQTPINGLMLRLCGAISIKNTVIRPTGVSTTLTVLGDRLPIPMDHDATLATALVTHPNHALPPPFASPPKGKGNGRKAVKLTATGKARTFLLVTIRTRLPRHCMKNLPLLQLPVGGTKKN